MNFAEHNRILRIFLRTLHGCAFVACLALIAFIAIAAEEPPKQHMRESVPAPGTDPVNWIGEQIEYRVAFGIVPAGKARLTVLDTLTLDGHPVVHAMSTARSAKAFDVVFKVRDTVETWFDSDTVYAFRSRKKLSEGRYHEEDIVQFDYEHGTAQIWTNGKPKPSLKVDPGVQDVLSAGYKARTIALTVGDTVAIKTHDVDKTYDLLVYVLKRETVETPAGSFDCFKVEPVLRSGGLFKKEHSARVFIWVTADDRRIPVQMQSKVSFGSVTAVMDSYTPPIKFR